MRTHPVENVAKVGRGVGGRVAKRRGGAREATCGGGARRVRKQRAPLGHTGRRVCWAADDRGGTLGKARTLRWAVRFGGHVDAAVDHVDFGALGVLDGRGGAELRAGGRTEETDMSEREQRRRQYTDTSAERNSQAAWNAASVSSWCG